MRSGSPAVPGESTPYTQRADLACGYQGGPTTEYFEQNSADAHSLMADFHRHVSVVVSVAAAVSVTVSVNVSVKTVSVPAAYAVAAGACARQ